MLNKQNSGPITPPNEDVSQDTRRKIAVLKKAILKEREETQKEFEDIENLKKKLSILELTLSEKDSQIQIRNNEREKLEKELESLKEKSKQAGSPLLIPESQKSIASLKQENKKLLDEYYYIKQQNQDLKTKFLGLTQQHQEIQKQIGLKDDHLKKVVNELQETYAEITRQHEIVEKDLKLSKNQFIILSDTQNRLKNELSETLEKQKSLEEEILNLHKELSAKKAQIAKLNERLLKQSENEAILSTKLMQYKNELVEAESYFQKHEAFKITNFMNVKVFIVLKRDHTGHYVLEIEERNNKVCFPVRNIELVALHPHSDKRFYIRMSEGQVIEFENLAAENIVGKINFFLDRAKDE